MHLSSRSILASLVALALGAGVAQAQNVNSLRQTASQNGTDLGKAWPNATDVSSSPNYHVYTFQRGTTTYIQVNDASGKVRGAFARTPYSVIGLPIGSDAARVATPDEPLPAPTSTAGETIYQDGTIKVFVAPQADNTLQLRAVSGNCKDDPIECSSKGP